MECKWFTKPQRRTNNLSKTELHKYTPDQRNTLYRYKLFPHTNTQTMPHHPPRRTAHGGTAILIKESIQHYELLKYEEESIQATLTL